MNEDIVLNFSSPCGRYTLTFEDDGKVGYAYLKEGDKIVGDVWLYNRCETPSKPEWKDRSKAPFANPSGYAAEGGTVREKIEPNAVKVNWEEDTGKLEAYVYIFEDLYGILGVGDKPGFARHALKNGPLAKIIEIE